MKKILFLLGLLVPAMGFAQQAFTVSGKIGKVSTPALAYLLYQQGAIKVVDSALIVNGSFTIIGTVPSPSFAMLVIDHKGVGMAKLGNTPDMLNLFVDQGTISISTEKDSIKYADITGSILNDDNKQLTAQIATVMASAKKLNDDRLAATPQQAATAEFQRSIQERIKTLQNNQRGVLKTFITSHPKSFLSLIVLSQLGKQNTETAELDRLFETLDWTIKNMEMGKVLKKSIDEARITAIGSLAPDFTQPDADGKPVKLSSFKGKYVLIDFWASWCGPCRAENPNVVKAYQKYKSKNFTILGVSLDRPNDKAAWMAAVNKDGLEWAQVSDLKYWSNAAAALYFVQSIPANFLLDPAGKIIAKNLRGTDLEDKLAELLAK
ncbi:redoxin domain-containing protein [Mucilaginibacter antarcticus]|uniref:Redoxin domain-containing protein n=1 Tax=Mucilaginibacter antarcticus TaxID=1855725 RepID=A0ABW5XTG2_9SPHI